jgi:hypothetical protein
MTPSKNDEPIDILRKLDRLGLGVLRDQVEFEVAEGANQRTCRAFVLQDRNDDRDTVWVGPAIQVTWKDDAEPGLRLDVDRQRGIGGNPGKLAEYLEKAGGTVTVQWKVPTPGSKEIEGLREESTAGLRYIDQDWIVQV